MYDDGDSQNLDFKAEHVRLLLRPRSGGEHNGGAVRAAPAGFGAVQRDLDEVLSAARVQPLHATGFVAKVLAQRDTWHVHQTVLTGHWRSGRLDLVREWVWRTLEPA